MIKERDFFLQIFFYCLYVIVFLVQPLFSIADFKRDKCHKVFSKQENNLYEWMSYKEARDLIQEINIKTKQDFFRFALSEDKPQNLPLTPNKVYKEWTGWEDFLGVKIEEEKNLETQKKGELFLENLKNLLDEEFEGFNELGEFDDLGVGKELDYLNEAKLSSDLPALDKNDEPQKRRKPKNVNWMSYEEAKKFIRNQAIRSSHQFFKWSASTNRPFNFPSNPVQVYKERWKGWNSFLGITDINWMSYETAKAFIRTQAVFSNSQFREWRKLSRRPANFPANPDRFYKEEWESWPEFLGTAKNHSIGREDKS